MAGDNVVRSLLEKMIQQASNAYLSILERWIQVGNKKICFQILILVKYLIPLWNQFKIQNWTLFWLWLSFFFNVWVWLGLVSFHRTPWIQHWKYIFVEKSSDYSNIITRIFENHYMHPSSSWLNLMVCLLFRWCFWWFYLKKMNEMSILLHCINQ